jgi:hypothetical protein
MVFHADYEHDFVIIRATGTSNQWEASFETLATVRAMTTAEARELWINEQNPTPAEIAEAQVILVENIFP